MWELRLPQSALTQPQTPTVASFRKSCEGEVSLLLTGEVVKARRTFLPAGAGVKSAMDGTSKGTYHQLGQRCTMYRRVTKNEGNLWSGDPGGVAHST